MPRFISIPAILLATLLCGCSRMVENRAEQGRLAERGPVFELDGKPVRHGMWTGWYPDGQRAWKVRYVRGTPVGLRREWHDNGVASAEIKLGWDGKPVPGARQKRWDTAGTPVEPAKEPKQETEKTHG